MANVEGEFNRPSASAALNLLNGLLSSPTSFNDVRIDLETKTRNVLEEEEQRENQVEVHLRNTMQRIYPRSKVYPFGSRSVGMGYPDCILTLYFDSENNYHGNPSYDKDSQNRVLKAVFKEIRRSHVCQKVTRRPGIVIYTNTDASLTCGVYVANGLQHRNTLLLKMFLQLDARVRPLMLLVADLIYRCDLSKYFTAHVLRIMVIMYLQHLIPVPVLPTLDSLRQNLPCDDVNIKGFDCPLPKDVSTHPPSQNNDTLEKLFYGFCKFYKNFNWKDKIVSIQGPSLERLMFRPNSQVPVPHDVKPPLLTYLQKLRSSTDETIPCINLQVPIVVQDPLELSLNVAEKVTSSAFQSFTMMCDAAETLMGAWV